MHTPHIHYCLNCLVEIIDCIDYAKLLQFKTRPKFSATNYFLSFDNSNRYISTLFLQYKYLS